MKIKLKQDFGHMGAGEIVNVATDGFETPLSPYWRRRFNENSNGHLFEILGKTEVKVKVKSKKISNPEKDNTKEKG